MPQMYPSNWLFYLIYFSWFLLITFIMLYTNFHQQFMTNNNLQSLISYYWLW